MGNKVSNVSFDKDFINGVKVKPRVRCFTRSNDNMKVFKKNIQILKNWSKDQSICTVSNRVSLNSYSKQVNHFYDLRV
jgi:hypothetical protein